MSTNRSHASGFSLIELAVVVLVMGTVLAFGIPALQSLGNSYQLKGATANVAAQMRLAREKAISTQSDQVFHFTPNYPPGTDFDYHIHNGATVGPCWALPNGVEFYSVGVNPTMTRDGRSNSSGLVILQDRRGNRDTISVQSSGLILVN